MFLTKPISLRLRLHPVYYKYGYMSCQSFLINMNVKKSSYRNKKRSTRDVLMA